MAMKRPASCAARRYLPSSYHAGPSAMFGQPCGLLVNASSRAITGVRVDKLTTDRGWPCGVACAVAAAVTTVSGVEAGAGDTVVVDVCPCGAQPAAATTAAINSAHADVCRLHA